MMNSNTPEDELPSPPVEENLTLEHIRAALGDPRYDPEEHTREELRKILIKELQRMHEGRILGWVDVLEEAIEIEHFHAEWAPAILQTFDNIGEDLYNHWDQAGRPKIRIQLSDTAEKFIKRKPEDEKMKDGDNRSD